MNGFLLVALGGGLGAAARHGLGLAAVRLNLSGWPWATFTANLVGSLLMGFVFGLLAYRGEMLGGGQNARLFLMTGVLGGFTTFSAFSLETWNYIDRGDWARAIAYAGGSVVLGVAALVAGLLLARRLFA